MALRRKSAGTAGFSLLEVVVVISVLVAMAAVLVPSLGSVMESSKVAEVASLTDALKSACTIHYMDTSRFPYEYTGARYSAAQYHGLSKEQTYAGWKGPYLEEPLGAGHHPWKGSLHLYNLLLVNGLAGWDLDLDGTYELTTQENTCVLWMNRVPEEAAEDIDDALDKGDLGSGVYWKTAGRVQWASPGGGTLWVMIYRRGS